MVTIATHILNKYLPNKTLPTYTFLSCKQTHQTLATTVYKTGHSPLNTTISQHLVKIHLIGEQIQNISDLQSTDITIRQTEPAWHRVVEAKRTFLFLPSDLIWHSVHKLSLRKQLKQNKSLIGDFITVLIEKVIRKKMTCSRTSGQKNNFKKKYIWQFGYTIRKNTSYAKAETIRDHCDGSFSSEIYALVFMSPWN